ncbi:MAG: class I SAM-dependent methyltransferase [Gammaproteobacteria bacterium]
MNNILEQGIPAGNYYDKYSSRNPLVKKLMRSFMQTFRHFLDGVEYLSVHEVGCGEGHLTMEICKRSQSVIASDFSSQVLNKAKNNLQEFGKNVTFLSENIYDLDVSAHKADLVVCCEVLEHLPDAEKAIEVLYQLTNKYIILSVPREPIWRMMNMCRGKYWKDLGNTPGHIQHWNSRQFRDFVQNHFKIIEIQQPLPWTFILGEK